MFCSMIKKALDDTEKQANESKNCFGDAVMTCQNGASTFQPKQNGGVFLSTRRINSFNFILYFGAPTLIPYQL